jgi:GNAT superfamily N-acetyltransferase
VSLHAPCSLLAEHDVTAFDCGVPSLNDWLKKRALANQVAGASRTFVVTDDARVVAYYALASGAVAPEASSGRFRRNMPNPIPVAILARLAIDRTQQGRGIGRALFQDAVRRVLHASDSIGIRGLLVHALNNDAKAFYLKLGLEPSPLSPLTLMATLSDLRATLI